MPNIALSEARVKALVPRTSAYDTRDPKLRGFGALVLPSGARRYFLHAQHRGVRTWKLVGDANAMTLDEARARAGSMLAAIRHQTDTTPCPQDTRCAIVAPRRGRPGRLTPRLETRLSRHGTPASPPWP